MMITERRVNAERRKLSRIKTDRRKAHRKLEWSFAGVIVSYILLVLVLAIRFTTG